MLIGGDANNASIELSEQEGLVRADGSEFFRVTLRENEFKASTRVYAFDPRDDGLAKFFAGLAKDWKGWDGSRKWSSLEGEFELYCEHDGLGHITTTARIHSNALGNGHGWTGQLRFGIVAGDLDRIATDISRFFGGGRVAVRRI